MVPGSAGDPEAPTRPLEPSTTPGFPVERGRQGPLEEPAAQITDLLEGGLEEQGLRDPELASRLAALVELVFSWSARINLTGHRDREGISRGLVLDSLGLPSLLPDVASVVDLGSGAGFPGLPIALTRPGCRVTLVESRVRRHHFQRTAIRELAIGNAAATLGRAEVLEPTLHRVAVARAVGPLEELVPWLMRWMEPGGLALVPIRRESDPPRLQGVSTVDMRRYRVPGVGAERWVWMGTKDAARRP